MAIRSFRCQLLLSVILAFVILLLFLHLTGITITVVSGSSMEPALSDGQVVIMQRVGRSGVPQGHPVVWATIGEGRNVIKRVIGYPGDLVELIDGDTFVNGECVMECITDSRDNCRFILLEGQYLLLGDNRADSIDGRCWSPHYVTLEQINGYVVGSELR